MSKHKPSLKIYAKMENMDEFQAIHDAARYVHMTEKQFLRIAGLRAVSEVIKQIKAAQTSENIELKSGVTNAPQSHATSEHQSDNQLEQSSEVINPQA